MTKGFIEKVYIQLFLKSWSFNTLKDKTVMCKSYGYKVEINFM